jgi:hypothetical protein
MRRKGGEDLMVVAVSPLQIEPTSFREDRCGQSPPNLQGCCVRAPGHSGYHRAPIELLHVTRGVVAYEYRWLDADQQAEVAASRRASVASQRV